MKRHLAAMTLGLICTLSHGGFVDGNKLKSLSDGYKRASQSNATTRDLMDANEFMGYVKGAHDSYDRALKCTPDKFTTGQLSAVVAKYLDANPEQWEQSGDILVFSAVSNAFPCKK